MNWLTSALCGARAQASLAHHALKLTPPASCRLSFYLYNTPDEVDQAVAAVAAINAGRRPATARRYRGRPARHLARSPLPVGSA